MNELPQQRSGNETEMVTHNIDDTFDEVLKKESIDIKLLLIIAFGLTVVLIVLFPSRLVVWCIPFSALIVYRLILMSIIRARVTQAFWKTVAREKGWVYTRSWTPKGASALLFNAGHSRWMGHILQGTYESIPIQIFQYRYVIGHGKHSKTHDSTVFAYQIQHTLPHLYVNCKKNNHYIKPPNARILPTSGDFAKKFELYITPEYEIEALAFLTPDVQQYLLDTGWTYDIEFVGNEILVIQDRHYYSRVMFEAKLSEITKSIRYLQERARAGNFLPIGDVPHLFIDIRDKLPFWHFDRYERETVMLFFLVIGFSFIILIPYSALLISALP